MHFRAMITKYRTLPEVEPTGQRGCLAVRPAAVVEMGGGHIVSSLGATVRFKCNISERVLCISSDLYTGIQTRALNLIAEPVVRRNRRNGDISGTLLLKRQMGSGITYQLALRCCKPSKCSSTYTSCTYYLRFFAPLN